VSFTEVDVSSHNDLAIRHCLEGISGITIRCDNLTDADLAQPVERRFRNVQRLGSWDRVRVGKKWNTAALAQR
jgi:hypothetical protein